MSFTKDDLKVGYLVEYRNGKRRLVTLNCRDELVLVGDGSWNGVAHYSANLINGSNLEDFDIMRVWGRSKVVDQSCIPNTAHRDLLWERTENEESTDLTANEYQRLARRTANDGADLSNAGLGIAGEAGEVADMIKKHLFQGHTLDESKLIDELGDVCWYVALAADCIGTDLGTILQRNIDKLKERYPKGFSEERSVNRKEN